MADNGVNFSESVSVSMRNYFSSNLLWAAEHHAASAAWIEDAHEGPSFYDPEHRAEVLSAVIAAWGFLEAAVKTPTMATAHRGTGTSPR